MTFSITHSWLATANAFLEDTCVIFTLAYLLSRGGTLTSLLSPQNRRDRARVGLLLGLVAATELIFPGMRSPYVADTLVVCFVSVMGGWLAAAPVIGVVLMGALILDPAAAASTAAVLIVVSAVAILCDRMAHHSRRPAVVGAVAGTAQFAALLATAVIHGELSAFGVRHAQWMSVPANAFGMALITLVVRDAEHRLRSERNRLDLERSKLLLVSADLAALRARIKPHFLFNTLAAIASVCTTDARQAELSLLKLGRLMRRTLEGESTSLTPLAQELEYVRAYVDIQTLRFGEDIQASFVFDPGAENAELPAFSLQTLVENAFQHGLSNRSGCGTVRITGRMIRRPSEQLEGHRSSRVVEKHETDRLLIAVSDDGAGMSADTRRRAVADSGELPKHGMAIIDKQLRLLYGQSARLRVFSEPDHGTLVAFSIPLSRKSSDRGSM